MQNFQSYAAPVSTTLAPPAQASRSQAIPMSGDADPSPLIWRDSWALGIDTLDADHRELLRLMNRLISTGAANAHGAADSYGRGDHEAGSNVLVGRLDELVAHLRVHFEREEAFLRTIDYPGYEEHAGEHAMEMAELIDLRRALVLASTQRLDRETIEDIKAWFFNHVIAEDQRYAEYYFRGVLGSGNGMR
ncbi:MAG: hemerythrin family protein [Pseudomonadota bacterium]|nr:hemerythrin family protein [Pseudomonadota bacterium]